MNGVLYFFISNRYDSLYNLGFYTFLERILLFYSFCSIKYPLKRRLMSVACTLALYKSYFKKTKLVFFRNAERTLSDIFHVCYTPSIEASIRYLLGLYFFFMDIKWRTKELFPKNIRGYRHSWVQ